MNKRYLIFERHAHPAVYFLQAPSTMEAIQAYIRNIDDEITFDKDGSVQDGTDRYPHPLAYIEAREKIHGEWQIREMPEWVWQNQVVEAFCGESVYGVSSAVARCRECFEENFPRARPKAFLWELKQGTLVTFYRRKSLQIKVLQRYLWNWAGNRETFEEWTGDYDAIVENLLLEPYQPKAFTYA